MKQFVSLNMKVVAAVVLAVAFSFFMGSKTYAQNISGAVNSLEFTQSPINPAPGQMVTITVESYSLDINNSTVVWAAGGKVLNKGVGLNKITVQAPAAGKRLTVNASAVDTNGNSLTGSVTINSGTVDMVVESEGYTPPAFQGKVPAAYQDTVQVTAIPHLANSSGIEYDPKTLVYKWVQDGSVLQDQSGYGHQTVIIAGNMVPRSSTLTVTITTRDGSLSGTGLITLNLQAPSILFYNNDPLYGTLFNSAIGNTVILGMQKELSVLAVPYGFNTASPASLSYEWLINSESHSELNSNSSITLRSPDGGQSGSSNINLTISNPSSILQQAQDDFTASWSAQTGSASSNVTF